MEGQPPFSLGGGRRPGRGALLLPTARWRCKCLTLPRMPPSTPCPFAQLRSNTST